MFHDTRSTAAVLAAASSLIAIFTATSDAGAEALPDPNLSPLIATIGLPNAADGAALVPQGAVQWRSSIATASHSAQDAAGNETLLFDGETTRLAFAIDYGFSDKLQIGVELPYLLNESGGLDSVVDTWHDWFGLPNGIRDLVDRDQLNFLYQADGVTRLDVSQNLRGIGDVRLSAAWQLRDEPLARTALRASLKLPSGDSSKLTGSGSADLSLGIVGDYDEIFDSPRWSGFYRSHVVIVGAPDRVGDRAKALIGVIAGGVSAQLNPRLELTMQGTLRSAAYDSAVRMLGDPSLLLEVGGTITLSDRLRLAIAVGEDVYVESAPDVSFALMLHYAPTTN